MSQALPPSASSSPTRFARHLPVLAVVAGIAAFSAMDAAMKGASIALGVFMALLLRNLLGTVMLVPVWFIAGRPLPTRAVFIVHVQRALITSGMAGLFFYGLVRIPIAEGIAISFISPIIALYLASLMLGERIRRSAIIAAVLGLFGVLVIGAGRLGQGAYSEEAIAGTAAVLCSAMLYALNLVFQRKQAKLAGPVEIALFQNGLATLVVASFAPVFWASGGGLPETGAITLAIVAAALASLAHLFLSWGYARAEAQVLLPVEYTGFLWASLLGWVFFDESVTVWTVAGALLIVAGCWISTRNAPDETIV